VILSSPLKQGTEAKNHEIVLGGGGPQSSIFSGSTQKFSVFALWAQNWISCAPRALFLNGARRTPCFSGLLRITSFSVHPKTPILGGVVWLYCTILTIFAEIDLHFSVLRADRHTTETHTDTPHAHTDTNFMANAAFQKLQTCNSHRNLLVWRPKA
jgi:hypothetical protein